MFDEYRLYDIIEIKEDRNGADRHFIITPDESWEEHAQLISWLDFLSAHNSHWPSQGYLILYINRSISFIYLFICFYLNTLIKQHKSPARNLYSWVPNPVWNRQTAPIDRHVCIFGIKPS